MRDAGDGTHPVLIACGRNPSSGVRKTTMQVRVKLFATLGRYALNGVAGAPFEMEFSEGATLDDMVDRLNLPRDEVKVFFVNGRARPKDWILKPGDEVGIFPLVAGG
jgi:molybdopterin synthase sulfur carrier subunit